MTLHLLSTFVLASHWLIVAGLSVRVIMRRPAVGVSLAWLVIIASTPFLGAVVYLLLGEKRLGRRRAARVAAGIGQVRQWQATLRREYDPTITRIGAAARALIVHGERTLGFPAQDGNQVELLSNFPAVFERLVADIDAARTSCDLCFYIWHEGGRADEVVQALMRAARRGVRCRALADAVGSKRFLAGVQACRLRQAGVELSAALPTGLLSTLFVRRDLRYHRKIAIIDDRVAYTGSQNLVDPRYFKQGSGVGEWVDAVVRITGPAAAALGGVFAWDWSLETGGACELPRMADLASPPPGGVIAQVLASGPDLRPEAIHQLVLTSIYASRRELVMTTPYFVPDESILTALLSAAQRGVAVTLIVPARNDSLLVRHASVAHFDDLMSAGVRIALFRGGLLHTKSLTIDGEISFIGSVNLDMRSFWLNFEISLFIYDRSFAEELMRLQATYLSASDLLDLGVWRRRPAWRKFVENTFRLAGPLL